MILLYSRSGEKKAEGKRGKEGAITKKSQFTGGKER